MGIINDAKGGADLTKPRASVGWMIGAVVAVAVLLAAVGIGSFLYGKAKSAVSGVTGKMPGGYLETQSLQGAGSGWL